MTNGYQPDPKMGPLLDPRDSVTYKIEDDVLVDIISRLKIKGCKIDIDIARLFAKEISKVFIYDPYSEITDYKVKVYVAHGYYEYSVGNKEQAMAHAQQIAQSKVYRRVTETGDVEFHMPYKVKVSGPGLDSQYRDTFVRT